MKKEKERKKERKKESVTDTGHNETHLIKNIDFFQECKFQTCPCILCIRRNFFLGHEGTTSGDGGWPTGKDYWTFCELWNGGQR